MPDNKFTRHAIDSSFPQDLCKNVEETLENQSLKDSTIKVLAVGTKLEVVTALNRYREVSSASSLMNSHSNSATVSSKVPIDL